MKEFEHMNMKVALTQWSGIQHVLRLPTKTYSKVPTQSGNWAIVGQRPGTNLEE